MKHSAFTIVVGCTLLGILGSLQAQSVFRWVDSAGRVHYTDHPPQEAAKQVQEKRLTPSMIQTSGDSYIMQVATRKYPATLFISGDCGEVCDKAKAFLEKRGVTFTEIDTNSQSSKLIKITGNTKVPVLTLGTEIVIRGWEETRWNNALDQAGYPKYALRKNASPSQAAPSSGSDPSVSSKPTSSSDNAPN